MGQHRRYKAVAMSVRFCASKLLLLAVLATAGGCSSAEPQDRTQPPELTACEAAVTDFVVALHEAKTCDSTVECVFQTGTAPIQEWCGSGYFVNKNYDLWQAPSAGGVSLKTREKDLGQCYGPSGLCFEPPPSGTCWRNRCWSAPQYGVSQDACFSKSDGGAWHECLCGACPRALSDCLDDAGCSQLLSCVTKSGCARVPACSPQGPCGPEVDDIGGLSSDAGRKYASVEQCRQWTGCFAFAP